MCAGHVTIYSHFPHYCRVSESTRFKGVARVSSFPFRDFAAVLSLLLKVLCLGLDFPFKISTFFHSLEYILWVSGQFTLSSLLTLSWSQKLGGGGGENLTFISNGSLLSGQMSLTSCQMSHCLTINYIQRWMKWLNDLILTSIILYYLWYLSFHLIGLI